MLDYDQYIKDAARTDTDYAAYEATLARAAYAASLVQFLDYCKRLHFDDWKKLLFYGKEPPTGMGAVLTSHIKNLSPETRLFRDRMLEPNARRLLHGALGRITEGLEILETLFKYGDTGQLDMLNVAEESGDGKWYDARIDEVLAECGFVPETIFHANIEKLRARYPGKFSNEAALNRNPKSEMQALGKRLAENGGDPR